MGYGVPYGLPYGVPYGAAYGVPYGAAYGEAYGGSHRVTRAKKHVTRRYLVTSLGYGKSRKCRGHT